MIPTMMTVFDNDDSAPQQSQENITIFDDDDNALQQHQGSMMVTTVFDNVESIAQQQ